MNLDSENKTIAQKANDFLNSNKKIILGVFAGVIAIGVVAFAYMHFAKKANAEAIASVEKIIDDLEEFKSKNKTEAEKKDVNSSKEDSEKKETSEKNDAKENKEVIAEEDKAIEALKVLTEKKKDGYAAFRANTVIAEIYFQRKDFEKALPFYELASDATKAGYTAGIAYFNVAACADELDDNEKALSFYEKASQVKDFPLSPRALFNVGRLYEVSKKNKDAIKSYNKLLEKYPNNEWALLAKSRIIVITKN